MLVLDFSWTPDDAPLEVVFCLEHRLFVAACLPSCFVFFLVLAAHALRRAAAALRWRGFAELPPKEVAASSPIAVAAMARADRSSASFVGMRLRCKEGSVLTVAGCRERGQTPDGGSPAGTDRGKGSDQLSVARRETFAERLALGRSSRCQIRSLCIRPFASASLTDDSSRSFAGVERSCGTRGLTAKSKGPCTHPDADLSAARSRCHDPVDGRKIPLSAGSGELVAFATLFYLADVKSGPIARFMSRLPAALESR